MAESTALSPPRCPRRQWHLGSSWSQRAWDPALTVPALQEEGHLAALCPVVVWLPRAVRSLQPEAPLQKQPSGHTGEPHSRGMMGEVAQLPLSAARPCCLKRGLLSLKAIFS